MDFKGSEQVLEEKRQQLHEEMYKPEAVSEALQTTTAVQEKVETKSEEMQQLERVAAAHQYHTPKMAVERKEAVKESTEQKAASKRKKTYREKQAGPVLKNEQKDIYENYKEEPPNPVWNDAQKAVYNTLSLEQKRMALCLSKEIPPLENEKQNVMLMDANEKLARGIPHEKLSAGKDRRVIKILLHGVKMDENGVPLNEQEKQHLREDKQRIREYESNNVEVSRKVLDPLVKELLEYPFENLEHDLEKELLTNTAQFKVFMDKFVYLENAVENHPEYFGKPTKKTAKGDYSRYTGGIVPQKTMDRLRAAQKLMVGVTGYATALAGSCGINLNDGDMYDVEAPLILFRDNLEMLKKEFETAQSVYRREKIGVSMGIVRRREKKKKD